jgi:hypothetical protein
MVVIYYSDSWHRLHRPCLGDVFQQSAWRECDGEEKRKYVFDKKFEMLRACNRIGSAEMAASRTAPPVSQRSGTINCDFQNSRFAA